MTSRRFPRPSVLNRVPLDRHVVIEASAGAGKTFTLEHIVVELLLTTETTLDEVLIVTFTEKATHELRARIRTKLEEMSSDELGHTGPIEGEADAFWTVDHAARAKLDSAVRAFDGATITTIHAFCQRVVRENAFASGRLFDEQQVDGREAFGRALRDALRRDVAGDPDRAPWLEAALRSGWSIQRIEDLLWKCWTSRGALRPEFARIELAAALEAMPVIGAGDRALVEEIKSWRVHASRASAIGRRLYELASVAERGRRSGDLPQFVLDASRIELSKLIDGLGFVVSRPGRAEHACSTGLRLARATPPFPAALAGALLPSVKGTLVRGKRETGRYDFDDMLTLLDEGLKGPRGADLARALRRRWRHVLIDEFQDTDETQWSIFRRAFLETATDMPRSFVIFVADPKQSIYRFRGADVNTYLSARQTLCEAGSTPVVLDRNYRATPALVRATNALFDPNAPEPLLSGAIAYEPVLCGRPDRRFVDGDGRDLSAVHVLRVRGQPSTSWLPLLGAAIARTIRAATDPARPWRMDGEPIGFHHCFVLTRTAAEGRKVGVALREAGVPHAFYKADGLFQTHEARDIQALLSAILAPDSRGRRLAAWLTPFFCVPLDELGRAADLSGGHPLVARLHAWKALANRREFERLFEGVVRDSGIVRRAIFFSDGERELTNYLHLFELLLERARQGQATLADLANELSGLIARTRSPIRLEGDVQRLESERRAVQIMTIHKSKGLEAPLVFLAGGTSLSPREDVRVYHEGGRRLTWAGEPSPEVAPLMTLEERGEDERIMYVALTRAMGRLCVPCFVDDAGQAKRLRGPYDRVNGRLLELTHDEAAGVTVEDAAPVVPRPRPLRSEQAALWTPSASLLSDRDPATKYDALRRLHAGTVVTSYTRIKSEQGGGGPVQRSPSSPKRRPSLDVPAASSPDILRSARSSGVFLHELLERVPLKSFVEDPRLEVWRQRADVRALIDEAISVHRVARNEREHAERLLWAAYATPLRLPSGEHIAGLATAPLVAREMPFVYPTAEAGHRTSPVLVRGSLDLAFEHRGLTYFVDWKSDSMSSYSLEALDRQVSEQYAQQLRLYALAVTKLLGIQGHDDYERRFGGIIYCFLRGLEPNGNGLWSARPSFNEVLAWAEGLRSWLPEPDR